MRTLPLEYVLDKDFVVIIGIYKLYKYKTKWQHTNDMLLFSQTLLILNLFMVSEQIIDPMAASQNSGIPCKIVQFFLHYSTTKPFSQTP